MAGKAGRSGRWARWSKYITNADELEAIMMKGCKGSVTELTKVAARLLYENTYKAFGPGHESHLTVKRTPKVPYQQTGTIANTIAISKTVRGGDEDDAFTNVVYFDEDRLLGKVVSKSHEYLGRYTDVNYSDVEMPGFIELLEEGAVITEPHMAKFSREGAGFIEATEQDIYNFINSGKMDFIVEKNMEVEMTKKTMRGTEDVTRAGVTITRYK